MLFRTVYGPELEVIYLFITEAEIPLSRQAVHSAFISQLPEAGVVSTQSVDDALAFLESAYLMVGRPGGYEVSPLSQDLSFRLRTLRQLRALELGQLEPLHPLDPLYLLILTQVFIQADQFFVADLHQAANKLPQVAAAGGLSHEKIQAWKRVMEFLGVGRRVLGGFQCAFAPGLVLEILEQHVNQAEVLQTFLEEHLAKLLPWQTERGNLPQAIEGSLRYLEQTGQISLNPLQDSPNKPYFGDRKIRQIVRREVSYAG